MPFRVGASIPLVYDLRMGLAQGQGLRQEEGPGSEGVNKSGVPEQAAPTRPIWAQSAGDGEHWLLASGCVLGR